MQELDKNYNLANPISNMNRSLSLAGLLAYGLPGFPLAVLGLPLYVYLPTYYARDLMLGPAAVGGVLMAARVFDVITDPLAGWVSDQVLPARLRRRVMLVTGMPILLLGVWMLFLPPAEASALWLLIGTMLAYLGWTLIDIPHAAWSAELSADYHERSWLATSREGFRVLGVFVALTLPTLTGMQENLGAILRQLFFMVIVSLPLAVGIAASVLKESGRAFHSPPWTESLRLLFNNPPLRQLLLAYVLDGLANGLPATLFLLFTAERLGENQPELLLILYFGMGVVGVPIWLWLARKIGKHRAWAVALALAVLSFLSVPWLGPEHRRLFAVTVALTGFTLGGDMALPVAMQADVVDVDTALGGGRRAGFLFGLWGMATKLALALAVGIAFPLLELFGYDPSLQTQPSSALNALGWLYAGLPALLKLLCLRIAWHFPLDAKAHAQIQRQLQESLPKAQNPARRRRIL
jgi:Na+/melibiose symporter-like transporter